jgi:hypothetical protein
MNSFFQFITLSQYIIAGPGLYLKKKAPQGYQREIGMTNQPTNKQTNKIANSLTNAPKINSLKKRKRLFDCHENCGPWPHILFKYLFAVSFSPLLFHFLPFLPSVFFSSSFFLLGDSWCFNDL